MTYTYAELEVSARTYAEVRELLDQAGYQQAFHKNPGDDHEVIDMRGIALKAAAPPKFTNPDVVRSFLRDLGVPEEHWAEELRADEDYHRASGKSLCDDCGEFYARHPRGGPIGVGNVQFLRRLCNGDLVKL